MSDIFMYERNGIVLLDPLGSILSLLVVVVLGLLVAMTTLPRPLKNLIYVALALRVVGALSRYMVLFGVYNGSGDARRYYRNGITHAESFWNLDFRFLYTPDLWTRGNWTGTSFVDFPATFVHTLIGPSMLGGFIFFSLFAFVGLCGFVVAFHRANPEAPVTNYARWIWLFPALWYWPSSIGKEAIVLFGLGLAIAGYIGRNGRINWPLLAVGVFFVFAIRAQVAAVLIVSILFAHWLSMMTGRWTLLRTVQAVALIGLGTAALFTALRFSGIEALDLNEVSGYLEDNKGRDLGGGSSVTAAEVSLAGIPIALINIMFRPFLFEAHNFMALLTALEITAFWTIVWFRRHVFVNALRNWRYDRLLRVVIPFVLFYSIALGMAVSNMGLIARQRIFIFPFLFLLVEAVPRVQRAVNRAPVAAPRRVGAPRNRVRALAPAARGAVQGVR